jgi:hypothetical protein
MKKVNIVLRKLKKRQVCKHWSRDLGDNENKIPLRKSNLIAIIILMVLFI